MHAVLFLVVVASLWFAFWGFVGCWLIVCSVIARYKFVRFVSGVVCGSGCCFW